MFRKGLLLLTVCAGMAALILGGCPSPSTTGGGDANDPGQAEFAQLCGRCHTPASVAPARGRITTNMGTVSGAMSGITLTAQQIADLQAYLATQ
jgi:mono/diheme cytochrome c family protein